MNPATDQPNPSASPNCMCGGKGPALSEMIRLMMPSGKADEHFRNGTLEFLKGIRELLDQRIQSMSATAGRGTKLNVE
jgi:hypothetical protein